MWTKHLAKLYSKVIAILLQIPTFMYYNKLTIKVVSKPLLGLTILSQAFIHIPNTGPYRYDTI